MALRADQGYYDIWVCGPNGFVCEFRGLVNEETASTPEVELVYEAARNSIRVVLSNEGRGADLLMLRANAYRKDGPWTLRVIQGRHIVRKWVVNASHGWYDFTVTAEGFERRFAGRMETGDHSISDPAV